MLQNLVLVDDLRCSHGLASHAVQQKELARPPDLLIVGASARAAAHSALRRGMHVAAADCFGDSDLAAICASHRVEPYPQGLVDWIQRWPGVPWIYTGALENHVDLLEELARHNPLLGNAAQQVEQARNPSRLSAVLRGAGLHFPSVTHAIDAHASTREWLVKSIHSASGRRVRKLTTVTPQSIDLASDEYLQAYIDGQPISGLCVAAQGRSQLVGLAWQFIGEDWHGGREFWYGGSLTCASPPAGIVAQFERAAEALAESFKLQGLFGVDAVLRDGCVWVIEVNPRYTASVEILERARELSFLDAHLNACREGRLPGVLPPPRRVVGKAILYARRDGQVTPAFLEWAQALNQGQPWPTVADIPHPTWPLLRGWPIATLLAADASEPAVTRRLKRLASQAMELLGQGTADR